MSGLNKIEAEKVVSNLNEDERTDLLMYLAEIEDAKVIRNAIDITYFISSGDEEDGDYDKLDTLLTRNGWDLECCSPLEISEKDNPESRATGYAAQIVIETLKQDDK